MEGVWVAAANGGVAGLPTWCVTLPIRKASLLVWGEKRDSEEKGLLNMVTSGGV